MILGENCFDFSVEISDLGNPELKISLRKYLSVRSLYNPLNLFWPRAPQKCISGQHIYGRDRLFWIFVKIDLCFVKHWGLTTNQSYRIGWTSGTSQADKQNLDRIFVLQKMARNIMSGDSMLLCWYMKKTERSLTKPVLFCIYSSILSIIVFWNECHHLLPVSIST